MMKCPKCGTEAQSGARKCSSCSVNLTPAFNRFLPPVLAGLAVVSLVLFTISGIRAGELRQALTVMIPLTSLALGAAYGVRRVESWGWYLWTFVLGLALIGTFMRVLMMEPYGGFVAGVFFWTTAICVGVLWRTRREKIWNRTAVTYFGANTILLLAAVVTADAVVQAVFSFIIAIAFIALILWTYAIRVRWWNHIGLGWAGGQIS